MREKIRGYWYSLQAKCAIIPERKQRKYIALGIIIIVAAGLTVAAMLK